MRYGRLILWILLFTGGVTPAFAESALAHIDHPICYAVTPLDRPDVPPPGDSLRCRGEPTGYQQASLWLAFPLHRMRADDQAQQLMRIYQGRYDRLLVLYRYADGHIVRQDVRRGHYGAHWRLGGQLLFPAPARDAPLAAVMLRVDRLTSLALLRAHLISIDKAGLEGTIAAALVGGALSLLLLCAIYNFALAFSMRREFLMWHGVWATLLLLWGLIWSQAALIAIPGLAGTLAAQICTFLACAAIAAATFSGIRSIEPELLPRPLRVATLGLALVVMLLGILADLTTGPQLDSRGDALSAAAVADILATAGCLLWAWRRGSVVARDFLLAWALPMIVLAVGEAVDIDDQFLGGGSQLAVLVTSALQMVWLMVSSSRRLGKMRRDYDRARATEARLTELARRDPLTGLLNRRGFLAMIEEMLAEGTDRDEVFGLLLIDIYHFKAVNDVFGHLAGDAVLRRIAGILRQSENGRCIVARLGGEEFVVGTRSLDVSRLGQMAETLRRAIGACPHAELRPDIRVTVSIGVATSFASAGFQGLYRLADQALYAAKRNGRDRVDHAPGTERLSPRVVELPRASRR